MVVCCAMYDDNAARVVVVDDVDDVVVDDVVDVVVVETVDVVVDYEYGFVNDVAVVGVVETVYDDVCVDCCIYVIQLRC